MQAAGHNRNPNGAPSATLAQFSLAESRLIACAHILRGEVGEEEPDLSAAEAAELQTRGQ